MSDIMPETARSRVARNENQGAFRKILCVCSGGILRSPTLAWILSNPPYNCNTRAAGSEHFALIPVDQVLIDWSDFTFFLNRENYEHASSRFNIPPEITKVLNIPDWFPYRHPELIKFLNEALVKAEVPHGSSETQ